ncbi:MAG: TonB family protein [Bradymonadia bacterium]|jgi:TonB family protein
MSKKLRVALVWHGTVMAEKSVRSGSVTIGGSKSNTFHMPNGTDDGSHELFTVSGGSATLTPTSSMTGAVTSNKVGKPLTGTGAVQIGSDDWGVIQEGDVAVYFQWVADDAALLGGGKLGMDFNLASTTAVSAAGHVLFLIAAFLLHDPTVQSGEFEVPDLFARIMVDDPPDAIEEVEEEDMPDDETTSKAAGGEEGKFGEEDAEIEDSTLPDHDGPLVDELQTTELGAALSAAIGATGALTNVFGASDMMSNTFGQDFATAGEGDVFMVGRGVGGMGMRGGGRGGGGDGFGRVGGVGSIDTGGGQGQGASLGRRSAREPRARMSRGRPNVNGFLTREQIERVVRRHSRGIRYCYERELANEPDLGGRISASWTVGLDGRVQSASITENSMGNRAVESCVLREVRRMRFDQPDGGLVSVTYPFSFRSEEG